MPRPEDLEHEFEVIRSALQHSPQHAVAILHIVRLAVGSIKAIGRDPTLTGVSGVGALDPHAERSRCQRAELLDGGR